MRRLRAVLSMAAVLVALAGCAPPPGVTVVLADVQRAEVTVEGLVIWVDVEGYLSDGCQHFGTEVRQPASGRVEVDVVQWSVPDTGEFACTMALVPYSLRRPVAVVLPGVYEVSVRGLGSESVATVRSPAV